MDSIHSILGGKSVWWMVLWTAAIFHLSGASTSINIAVIPPHPTVSSHVILMPPLPEDKIVFCKWSRGSTPQTMQEIGIRYLRPQTGTSEGPQYTGREKIFQNCTLSIQQLRSEDATTYELMEGAPGLMLIGSATVSFADSLNSDEKYQGRRMEDQMSI